MCYEKLFSADIEVIIGKADRILLLRKQVPYSVLLRKTVCDKIDIQTGTSANNSVTSTNIVSKRFSMLFVLYSSQHIGI